MTKEVKHKCPHSFSSGVSKNVFSLWLWIKGICAQYSSLEKATGKPQSEAFMELKIRIITMKPIKYQRSWYLCKQSTGCYSVEKSMDGEAWKAIVHGVAKSRTQLSDLTFFLSLHHFIFLLTVNEIYSCFIFLPTPCIVVAI